MTTDKLELNGQTMDARPLNPPLSVVIGLRAPRAPLDSTQEPLPRYQDGLQDGRVPLQYHTRACRFSQKRSDKPK